MRIHIRPELSLFLILGLLNACGGEEGSTASANRIISNPTSQPPGQSGDSDEDPNNDPNQVDLSQHKSFGINQEVQLELPADYQGFCIEETNGGQITSNAEWTLGPSGVTNIQLTETNRCRPKVKLVSGYQESFKATVTARVPMPNNQVLSFVVKAHLRLPPAVTTPAAAIDLNSNMPNYTGEASASPPFSGGPNYNTDGPKMRFSSNGAMRWFRDGNKAANRHWGFMVAVADPSEFEPTLSDFTYSAACTSSAFTCSNYCPFVVEMMTINNNRYAKFSFNGQTTATTDFYGNPASIFFINDDQCITNNAGNTPININLKVTSPGGTTSKHVGTLTIEVDPRIPFL